jgi:hypothetical protein
VTYQSDDRAPWHRLLAPFPAEAQPRRQPVAPPEVLRGPNGWAVAGWEQVVLHLSAGPAGSRTIMAVLDGDGVLLSGSDGVLFRRGLEGGSIPSDCEAPALIHQEMVGGRFESDGSFHGTRWLSVAVDDGREGDLDWESTPSAPTAADAADLQNLLRELIGIGAPRHSLEET